jgi:hypothetical protein
MTRTQLINRIIRANGYKTYLEIGVSTPVPRDYNWDNIKIAAKDSVDPDPAAHATYPVTSDRFFATLISHKYDLILVDGLHVFNQVHRDITNSLKWLCAKGTIVVHDCNPTHEIIQRSTPHPSTNLWCGDVWKAVMKLRMEEPELAVYTVNTDFGCGVICRGSQKLFKPNRGSANIYRYEFFNSNRKEILNLVSIETFRRRTPISKRNRYPERKTMEFLAHTSKKPAQGIGIIHNV